MEWFIGRECLTNDVVFKSSMVPAWHRLRGHIVHRLLNQEKTSTSSPSWRAKPPLPSPSFQSNFWPYDCGFLCVVISSLTTLWRMQVLQGYFYIDFLNSQPYRRNKKSSLPSQGLQLVVKDQSGGLSNRPHCHHLLYGSTIFSPVASFYTHITP